MDPIQAFLQANALVPPAFAPTSRYYGIDAPAAAAPTARPSFTCKRRFLPPPDNFALLRA